MLDALTLDQMRTFAAVVRAGSFRGGAEALHRVQSAVSFSIAALEEQLGVSLFDRSGYRPVLTPAGHALLEDVRAVLARVDALKARARELERGVELKLSIAIDTLFPIDLVAVALQRMHARFPEVAVRIEYTSLGGTTEALRSGRCVAAVAVPDGIEEDIARQFLVRLSTVAVVASSHPLARLARRRGAALDQAIVEHLQVVVEDPSGLTAGRDFGVISPNTWRTSDMQSKLAVIRAGVGWGTLPRWLVERDLAEGTLSRLPARKLGAAGEVIYDAYFSHRSDQALGLAARDFAKCLQAVLADPPSTREASHLAL
jgi:DNA-binding transcriptional LysR family regulator